MLSPEEQYLNLAKRILKDGTDVYNDRTGKVCRTVINADFEYDVGSGEFPMLTTKKTYYKKAIAELLGYLKGFSNAAQFREIGTDTWDANANVTQAWLDNPHRKGHDDMGLAYRFRGTELTVNGEAIYIDQYKDIIDNLSKGNDNRSLIMTAWNPYLNKFSCLNACMHTHHFSVLGDELHLTSYQRSIDVPLGLPFNMIQCYVLLALTAQINGLRAGKVFHKLVNCHIYSDQLENMAKQVERDPYPAPMLKIDENIKSLDDVEQWVGRDHFELIGYQHHDPISYAFSA